MSSFALIFASGIGSRMRSSIGPKQFMEINGKPILIYTLERFANHKKIDGIYIVVRQDKLAYTESLINKFSVGKIKMVVAGGDSAHGSIVNGIMSMKNDGVRDNDIVLIHDGVRPIIDEGTISRCIDSTVEFGNAITCMPAHETIAFKRGKNRIGKVTIRDNMIILQAPQSFRFKDAYEVNKKAIEDKIVGTVVDQAELNRHYGKNLHTIYGLKGNVKITVPLDFTYFEFLVKSGNYDHVIKGEVV